MMPASDCKPFQATGQLSQALSAVQSAMANLMPADDMQPHHLAWSPDSGAVVAKTFYWGLVNGGDRYLRTLLVQGARAVVLRAANRDGPLYRWIIRLLERRGWKKTVVAVANKMARIGWAILRHNARYEANLA